jgi:hypothetical protein
MEYENPEVKQDQVDAVKVWRKQSTLFRRQSINRRISSYGLKHIAERDLGMYISNDSFIEAMRQQGFKAQKIKETPNYFFNVSFGPRLKTIRNGAEYVPAYK